MGESQQRPDRRRRIGQIGEDMAARFVTEMGWQIIERNWRCRYGELDLIAAEGSRLVIVEVKTRASRTYLDPVAAVTREKLARMRRLARLWLSGQSTYWPLIRFDIVSVQLDPVALDDYGRASIRHHQGIVE